ncbi:MAG: caspase family protein [Armatimonadota bacterium]
MSERRHAVLIAGSRFPLEPKLQPLRCPENDVDGLNEVLTSPVYGQFTQTVVLKNVPHHEALLKINQTLKRADRNDVVLIYYSGHGRLDGAGRLHLATADTIEDALEATSIPVESIRNYVDVSPTSRVVLILDCCFSGAVGAAFARGGVDDQLQRVSSGRGTYLMTASTGIQVALEKEADQYGVFTKHLITGIRDGTADLDGDGQVTIDELYRHVHDRVLDEGFQEPMKWDLNVRGELVIAHTGRSPREDRRKQVRELLLGLATQGVLPDRVVAKAMEVNAADPARTAGSARQYSELLDQLVEKRLGLGEFVDRWYNVIEAPAQAPPVSQRATQPRGETSMGPSQAVQVKVPRVALAPKGRVVQSTALVQIGFLWLLVLLLASNRNQPGPGFWVVGLGGAAAGAILGEVSRRVRVWAGVVSGWLTNPLVTTAALFLWGSVGRVRDADAAAAFIVTAILGTVLSGLAIATVRRRLPIP